MNTIHTRRKLMMGLVLLTAGTLQTRADSIVAWGNNSFNQTFDAPMGTDFTSVAAGVASAYGLRTGGSISAWGYDGNSQVSGAPDLDGYTALAAGGYLASYALNAGLGSDGTITVWGDDSFGEVSNAPTDGGYIAISAGDGTGYALKADGAIVAWGNDANGQVSQKPAGAGFTTIAGGVATGYALRANGSIVAWGDNTYGEVSNVPAGTGYKGLVAGAYNAYAIKADGSVVAWGDNTYGQVARKPTGTGYKSLAAGGFTAIALKTDGSLKAWGDDSQGVVSKLPTGKSFTAISAGVYNGYALSTTEPLRQEKQVTADVLQALLPSGSTNRDVDRDISQAICYINASVDSRLWIDGDSLVVGRFHDHCNGYGSMVFLYEEAAVDALLDLKHEKNVPDNVTSTVQQVIDRLVAVDMELAKIAVEDATLAGGDKKELKKAVNSIAKAAQANQKGKYVQAIDNALQAWESAEASVNVRTCRHW